MHRPLILVVVVLVASSLTAAVWVAARGARPPGDAVVNGSEKTPPVDEREVKPCRITGCSGQVCSGEEVITTCEYRPEYECYKRAVCETGRDGTCGWRMDAELESCLQRNR